MVNQRREEWRRWLLRQPHSPEVEERLAELDGFPGWATRRDPDQEVTR